MRMDEKKRSERRAKQSRSRHMRREPKVDIVKNLSDQEEPTQLLRTSKSTRRVIEVTGKKSTDGLKTAKSARKKLREPKSGEQKSTEQKSKAREQKSSDVKSEEDKHEEKTEDKTALPTEGPLVGYDLIVPTSPNTLTPVRDKSLDEEMKKLAGQNASDDPNAIKDSKMVLILLKNDITKTDLNNTGSCIVRVGGRI